jgi:uncharacterized protein YuzE
MDSNVINLLPPIRKNNNEKAKRIKIYRLSCKNDESWALMPKLLKRIKAFCEKYDTETDPAYLIPQVSQMFAVDSPSMGLWCATNGNGKMIGHTLVTVETYCDKPYLLVMQAEVENNFPTKFTKQVLDEVIKWGKAKNINRIHITTERIPEAFTRKYKFKKRKTILIKEI